MCISYIFSASKQVHTLIGPCCACKQYLWWLIISPSVEMQQHPTPPLRESSWLWGQSCMLSCLCNESPGSFYSPTAPVVSNGKDSTHGAVQPEPPPLLPPSRECLCHCKTDRHCWPRNPPLWLTLLFPFPLSITLSLLPANHQKLMCLCYCHLDWFHHSHCIQLEWVSDKKQIFFFFGTFAWSN